jgi:hypothetical protein
MGGLIGICILFLLLCLIVFYMVGILLYKNNKIYLHKPSWTVFAAIAIQVLLFALFWAGVFEKASKSVIVIVWWAVALIGFIVGVKDFKNNFISSIPSILLSMFLAGFMLLMIFITSM